MRRPLLSFIHQSTLDMRQPFDNLTHVELTFRHKKIENWLCFGYRIELTIIDKRRSVASFKPDQYPAFMRWASNDYGEIISRLDIVRTIERGEAYQTLPFMRPGGKILLRVDNWPKVERVLQAIESIGIYLSDVSPAYWRQVNNRLAVNQEPRHDTQILHRALLLRDKVQR